MAGKHLSESDRNVANGFAGLDSEGRLPGVVSHLVGTDDEIDQIILDEGQIAFTSDTYEQRLGDGVTPGGVFIHGRMKNVFGNVAGIKNSYVTVVQFQTKPNRHYEYKIRVVNGGSTPSILFGASSLTIPFVVSPIMEIQTAETSGNLPTFPRAFIQSPTNSSGITNLVGFHHSGADSTLSRQQTITNAGLTCMIDGYFGTNSTTPNINFVVQAKSMTLDTNIQTFVNLMITRKA